MPNLIIALINGLWIYNYLYSNYFVSACDIHLLSLTCSYNIRISNFLILMFNLLTVQRANTYSQWLSQSSHPWKRQSPGNGTLPKFQKWNFPHQVPPSLSTPFAILAQWWGWGRTLPISDISPVLAGVPLAASTSFQLSCFRVFCFLSGIWMTQNPCRILKEVVFAVSVESFLTHHD